MDNMDSKDKIKKMVSDGKITSVQADLLLRALEESQRRREKVSQCLISQKIKRERKVLGILGGWFLLVLCVISMFFYFIVHQQYSGDIDRAVRHFEEANLYLEEGDYPQAVRYYKKGIEESPRFSLGYSYLGATYRLMYEQTKDESIKSKEKEAFQKARVLREDLKRRPKMTGLLILFILILVVLVLGVIGVIILLLYNSLVRKEEDVNEAWAQIETQYQRRLDLIPALLDAVKNYAQHERETYQLVTEARVKAQAVIDSAGGTALSTEGKLKEYLETQTGVRLGLERLFALVENYPNLKANTNFLTLQEQVEETEDKVSKAREVYNKRVRVYNSNVKYFPVNLVAYLGKFEVKQYFE